MFTLHLESPAQTRAIGASLAPIIRGGDLIMLTGDLGAGKTTLTQGLGAAMGVRGRVASPTFIIARTHVNPAGPDLVHVDAYRIGDLDDLETLDLDTALDEAVIVVEWGKGKTEGLSDNRLEITMEVAASGDAPMVEPFDLEAADDGARTVTVSAVGPRWNESTVESAMRAALKIAEFS
ncbi:MAG: tRNA (adenosine(37)-N6)-threonylcarbamoyltransferase complex ATPase subunit type 1 TsaE [Actinomycetaceae bacterium]|nr:tRNA (adenosine(37)-N6)-threonylcarbamoyltransferase complex ATPase subunit type 1 TsaE [Actinomycetaceae bacterium]